MHSLLHTPVSRRAIMKKGLVAGVGIALGSATVLEAATDTALPLITKPVPSTGEKLPVVGVGTNAYGVSTPEEIAARREVLEHLPKLGGRIVDTARGYGESEVVIGQLLAALGGRRGNLLPKVADKKLPEWAADFDITSWAQLLLKYNISHPAVNAVIPGTTKLSHLQDNQRAGRGKLLDAAARKRLEQFWETVS